MSSFEEKVKNIRGGPLVAKEVSILQVNLGYACNMSCKHCHLSAGPGRNETMSLETIEMVLDELRREGIGTLDITGGAPERHHELRNLEPVVDLFGGHADPAHHRRRTADTLVSVASTTKGFAAACLVHLAERGRLDLDAPVAHYWPEFAQAGKDAIPVRWLLCHRAGLPAIRAPLPPEALFD